MDTSRGSETARTVAFVKPSPPGSDRPICRSSLSTLPFPERSAVPPDAIPSVLVDPVPSHLRAAYEHIEDGVVVADADERVIYVNAAFERASEYKAGDVLGRTTDELLRPRPVAGESDVFEMTGANGARYFVRRK